MESKTFPTDKKQGTQNEGRWEVKSPGRPRGPSMPACCLYIFLNSGGE